MEEILRRALVIFELALIGYFLILNTLYLLFAAVAWVRLQRHRRRWTSRDLGSIMRSPATPGISIIAPAYNEEATLAESMRSLLLINYPQFEVVLVNDGSTDRTLDVAVREFDLLRAPPGHAQPLPSQPVRGIYRSPSFPELSVIDKENGGKADAINAGINAARHPIVCVIDADSLLEEHALMRAALPFIEDPDTIAAGGIVRIANGCTVERGRVVAVGLPKDPLPMFQVIEYFRAFLPARVAHSAVNALLIISGAFGMFRKDALVAAGGFRLDTVGEDMEIVTRLHHLYRSRRQRYRITFQPDPVCWTEAPSTMRVLARQRNRWQRGTLQVLSAYKFMLLNPRYRAVGLFSIPYYLLFEALGPIVEVTGYIVTIVAVWFGLVDWVFAELLFLVAIVYGTLNSLLAILLEELSFRRYPRVRDLVKMAAFGVIENFGYRQLTMWWRLRGIIAYLRGEQAWGAMTRTGFGGKSAL